MMNTTACRPVGPVDKSRPEHRMTIGRPGAIGVPARRGAAVLIVLLGVSPVLGAVVEAAARNESSARAPGEATATGGTPARPSGLPLPGAGWPPSVAALRRRAVEAEQPASRVDAGHAVLGRFVAAHPAWWVAADPLTGSIERGFGPGLPLPLVDPVGAVRAWLQQAEPLTSAPLGELSVRALPGGDRPGSVLWIEITQKHDGIPVLEAGMSVAVKAGHIVYLAGRALGPVRTRSRASVTAPEALARLERRLGARGLSWLKEPELAFVPEVTGERTVRRLGHRLVWKMMVVPRGEDAVEAHHAWVDAHTGDLVDLFPDALHTAACRADPRARLGQVRGGIRPNRADDPEVVRVFPAVLVDEDGVLKGTDLNGAYPYAGGSAESTLSGLDFDITCLVCAEQPRAQADTAGRIDFGSGGGSAGNPVIGNGLSTPAGRTTFYHLSQARQLFEKWDVAVFPQIRVEVNLAASCNALSSRYMVRFFQGGNSCGNTGEIRDVIDHELGHNWDRVDGIGITNLVRTDLSEWKGDMVAMLMGGDSCIGESFFLDPDSWSTTTCSGVRDIDEKAPGRRDHPLTPSECPTCATLTLSSNDCTTVTAHCNGEITGQATWHLKQNLLTGTDYVTGVVLPGNNPALSAQQTQYLLEKWLLAGGPPIKNWKPGKPGISPYEAITVEDDDDLDLGNGVPHGAYINAAFQHHELAESATIADSANCAAPPDPGVSVRVEPHPVTGRPRVRIDWTGGGEGVARVYRNWRIGDAFLPVGGAATDGPVFDDNVGVGETIRYLVVSVSPDGCGMISPGNNIATVTIDRPDIRVESAVVSEAAGDGDGIIEPGETARVQLTLEETGGLAGATGLAANLSSQDPFVLVPQRPRDRGHRPRRTRSRLRVRSFAGGGVFPDLSPGGRSTAVAPLLVGVAPDAPCPGDRLVPVSIVSSPK